MILNVDLDSYDDFNELGEAFEKKFPGKFSTLKLGHGIIKVINSTALPENGSTRKTTNLVMQ